MKPASSGKYDRLDDDSSSEPDMNMSGFDRQPRWPQNNLYRVVSLGTFFLCAVTTILNCVFIFHQWNRHDGGHTSSHHRDGTSKYALLPPFDTPMAIVAGEEFVNEDNLTSTSIAWETLRGDAGVVALSDEFIASKKLPIPTAYRYPWDTSKGVYLTQGHHNLHCLRTVFRSIMDYHHKRPQRVAMIHILHCLDELRLDVICNADDTPRYASAANRTGTGIGQVKMCRNWDRLEKWALENTACFRHEDDKLEPLINRFRHCPNGERPWEAVEGMA